MNYIKLSQFEIANRSHAKIFPEGCPKRSFGHSGNDRHLPDENAVPGALLKQMHARLDAFDGYLGAEFHRPVGTSREYVTVMRFADIEKLEAFQGSEAMERALVDVAPLIESDAVLEQITGLEFWFTPPEGTIVAQPSRHRMALLMAVVMFVLMISANKLLAPLVSLPSPVEQLFIVGLQVVLMTYVIMPWLSRLLSRWIYPKAQTVD